jgi:hypothetical protein
VAQSAKVIQDDPARAGRPSARAAVQRANMNKVDAARMESPLSMMSSILALSAKSEVLLLLKLVYQLSRMAMNDRKRLAPFRTFR